MDYDNILIERKAHTCNKWVDISIESEDTAEEISSSKRGSIISNVKINMNMNVSLDCMKILENIKHDEKFEKANLMFSKTFKPKPFLELEDM